MLAAGSRLGPYEILAPGRRGWDGGGVPGTWLGREVAIKVLPAALYVVEATP